MGIPAISLCAILAIVPLLWLPVLPERHTVWVMIAGGIALAAQRHNVLKYMGIMVLFCVCCAGKRLADATFNDGSSAGRDRNHGHRWCNNASGQHSACRWSALVGIHGRDAVWQLPAAKGMCRSALGYDAQAPACAWRAKRRGI